METTIMRYIGIIGCIYIYRGYIGIMEKKMETTIIYWGNIRVIVGSSLNRSPGFTRNEPVIYP